MPCSHRTSKKQRDNLESQDLDTIVGTPESRFVLSIVTTIVFGLFFLELILQCIFKTGYAFRAFFWLDIIALVSLLPETWFVQQLFNSDTLVAGRSTRLMKAIRLVVRSSKATRLNRFTRMAAGRHQIPFNCNASLESLHLVFVFNTLPVLTSLLEVRVSAMLPRIFKAMSPPKRLESPEHNVYNVYTMLEKMLKRCEARQERRAQQRC